MSTQAATTTPTTPPPTDELETLMTGARELFSLGDFSGSLELVEKVLQQNPTHEGARAYLKRNEATLLKMYESKLGRLGDVPRQLVPADEVIWLNMHHRAGFILSQVDGTLSYEDILDVSGMDRFDTIRILAELVANGIIGVK
jgi:CRP-like cAMP-binding protein